MSARAPLAAPSTPAVALTIGAELSVPEEAPYRLLEAVQALFTVTNPAYTEAVAHDRATADLPPVLRYWHRDQHHAVVVPRGALEAVYRLCQEHGVTPSWDDHTLVPPPVDYAECLPLSPAQERAVGAVLARRMGVLQAPAGAGKTTMAMAIIARRRQPALVLVHTRELAAQALRTAERVLGLDPAEVGMIGGGQWSIGERLTVALVQSLQGAIPAALRTHVGHVVVDECHHTPADSFAQVVSQFPARYLLGLSATPYRRDGLDQVIGWYLGPTVATMDAADLADRLIRPRVVKRDTGLSVRGNSFSEIVSRLVASPERHALIVADVAGAVAQGRRCLVLSDRVDHVEELVALLQAEGITAASLHDKQRPRVRERVVAQASAGELSVVVATCSLIGEGFDCPRLDALFLATPLSYEGRVTQYIGRVSRTAPGKRDAVVIDYCDDNRMLWATWRRRSDVYRSHALERTTCGPTGQLAWRAQIGR